MSDPSPLQPPGPQVRRKGITVLYGDLDSRLDIVFLHGLNGHPEKTWTHGESKFFWPCELRNHVKDARVMVFGYDADISADLGTDLVRIKGLAEMLLGSLANKRQEDEELNRPLIFVGHSLGGLVIKQALFLASQALSTQADDAHLIYHATKGIIFFGTPHLGSDVDRKKRVKLLKMIGRAAFTRVPPKLESALELHSDELSDLADNFRKTTLCTDRVLEIYTYHETRTNSNLGSRVVDEVSSKIGYDRETSQPIQADHQNMVKFKGEEDDGFDNVCGKIKKLRRHALTSPRAAKQAHRIPSYPPNSMEPIKTFVSRKTLVDQIRHQLSRDVESGVNEARIVGVWGSGGVGKSQLARSFVREHCNRYDSTFWVQSSNPDSIKRDYLAIYASLPNELVKKAEDPEPDEVRLAVLRAFTENSGRWLMVFDEVDGLNRTDENFVNIRQYIPNSPNIHVIITSRSAHVRDLSTFEGVQVGTLHPDEAVELFFRCAKIEKRQDDQEAEARLIVQDLGCLALGVSVAGSYISQTPSLSFNLGQYREERQQLLEQLLQELPREMIDMYDRNMVTTWEASFLAVMSQSPAACNTFMVLSFFHHEDIFPELLIQRYGQVEDAEAPCLQGLLALGFQADMGLHDVERRLSILEAYSLVQRDISRNSYSIHSLMHKWCRARLLASKDIEPCYFNLVAIQMLSDNKTHETDMGRRLMPHMKECMLATERLQLKPHDRSVAQHFADLQTLLYLKARSDYSNLVLLVMQKIDYYAQCNISRVGDIAEMLVQAISLKMEGKIFESVRILEPEGTTTIDEDEAPIDANYALVQSCISARRGEHLISVFKYISQRFQAILAESLRELTKARGNRERRKMVKTAKEFIQRVDGYLDGHLEAVTIPTHWGYYEDGKRCARLGSKDFGITCTTVEDAEQVHRILDPDFCERWLELCDLPVVDPKSDDLQGLFSQARAILSVVNRLSAVIEDRKLQGSRGNSDEADCSNVGVSLWRRFGQLLDRE